MRGALHLLWFELSERRALFAASLFLGLLALTAPLLPVYRHWSAGDVRGVAAFAAAGAFLLFAAVGVGSGILTGALSSGREGFYLARPVGTLALWVGRVGAAMVISLLAPALTLLPVGIAGAWRAADSVRTGGVMLLLFVPALIGGGALLRLTARARSLWLAALVVAMVLAAVAQLRLVVGPAIRFCGLASGGLRLAPFLAIPVLWALALLAGSAVAAVRGRIDLERAARWGAGTAVLLLAILTSLLVAGFLWVSAVTPHDLVDIYGLQSAPAGPWVVLSGRASRGGFQPRVDFLANVRKGRWERLDRRWGPVSFSGDGRFLAFGEVEPGAGPRVRMNRVRVLDLSAEGTDGLPVTVRTLPMDQTPHRAVLSPHGTGLLTIFGDHFTVWDVASGRPVARVRESAGKSLLAEVDDDGGVWLVLPVGGMGDRGARVLEVRHLPPGGRQTVAAWRVEGLDPGVSVLYPAGEGVEEVIALFVRDAGEGRRLMVRRLRTGEELWSAALDDALTPGEVLPLNARQVLVTLRRGRHGPVAAVELATPGGIRWRRALQAAGFAMATPGPTPSRVVLGINRHLGPGRWKQHTELLDLATGEGVLLGDDIYPAIPWWFSFRGCPPRAGSWGSRLFVRNHRELVLLGKDGTLEPLPFR
ncbi:MAG: hypothetical protein GXP47_07390 [Acidobacteria bacterium]|nr:hypothetical protein [Acidobacteriota bacterium]